MHNIFRSFTTQLPLDFSRICHISLSLQDNANRRNEMQNFFQRLASTRFVSTLFLSIPSTPQPISIVRPHYSPIIRQKNPTNALCFVSVSDSVTSPLKNSQLLSLMEADKNQKHGPLIDDLCM
ncbi:hypothetical protein M413DRAFT_136159 [Hebeloma cylindrosporum]|uniref:Uncharacterized protein n=1 Tax=Hebeloma cylindrosporum TaxID=76867 RepID=A0A0C2XVM6_HEBCY|nr:hypothetical protein M413DRAFT_136159 [Hebeloma cylindrosporum h7]